MMKTEKAKKWHPKFGDKVINTCAGENNPIRCGIFVKVVHVSGRMNRGDWYECTDGNGMFWQVKPEYVEVISTTRIAQDAPADGQTLKHTPPPRPSEPEAKTTQL